MDRRVASKAAVMVTVVDIGEAEVAAEVAALAITGLTDLSRLPIMNEL